MSQKKHRRKRRKTNPPKTTHVIEQSPDTLSDTASAPLSPDTGLEEGAPEKQAAEKRAFEKQAAEKRAFEKQAVEKRAPEKQAAEKWAAPQAAPFIPKSKSDFSPGRLIRPALTIAGAAVCLLVIMYFNARMAGSYPGAGILSSLRGKSAETYSPAPEESPSSANTVKAPAAETEADRQKAVTMSENAAVEKTDGSTSQTAETAREAEEESEEEYEDEEYYEEEYEYEEEEYEDEDEEYYEEEEEYYEEEEEYEYLEGELIDDFE